MSTQRKTTTITLPDHLSAEHAADLRVYVTDTAGKLIQTSSFSGQTAEIAASHRAAGPNRIFVAQKFPADYPADKIDAYALAAIGAYQLSPAASGKITIQNLPPGLRLPVPFHICNVQGNVTNTLSINGVSQTGPVCKAKVHICAVEWYFRWPIWLRPIVPVSIVSQLQELIAARRAQPSRTVQATAPKRLPVSVEDQLLAATPDIIHGIVAEHTTALLPFLCHYPIFWPWFLRLVEQEIVFTDCNGHFDAWRVVLGNPVENIYVWVEANINGNWVTVYNPFYPCNTHWNYACGTEIDISLANPAIPPCNCDGQVVDGTVWFTAIGNAAIATSIQQNFSSTALGIPNGGCTNIFDTHQLSPFGSTLNLYLASGPTLPASHYRWSWTLLDTAGNPTGPVNDITGAVSRYYLWPLPDGSWESGSISLQDTDSDGNIAYLLPNYDVTTYPGVSPLAEWVSFNFLSASLDSTKIQNGSVIRLTLELLNLESGIFTPITVPETTFQVSNDTNAASGYDGSQPAPANYLNTIGGEATGFTMILRIDNTPVTATMNDAWLLDSFGNPVPGGNSGPCGFIQFTDANQDVRLSFAASEPFNYANFHYNLYKGDTGALISVCGYVFTNPVSYKLGGSLEAFSLSGGIYTSTPTVTALLSGCPQAAFAETLSVASLATDGSSVLAQSLGYPYAASAAGAFALTPAASS